MIDDFRQQQCRRFPAAGAADGELRHRPRWTTAAHGARVSAPYASPTSGSTAVSSSCRNEIFRYIHPGEELVREPFQRLIEKQALLAYKCTGFWQCMDTFKDKQRLEELNQGTAPWKVWRETASRNVCDERAERSSARA